MSFEEVYAIIGTNGTGPLAERCTLMLDFITIIDEVFPETEIWGLTSHEDILILAEKDKTNVIARVSTQEPSAYKIEYGENFESLYPNNQYVTVPVHDKLSIQRILKRVFESEVSTTSNGNGDE